MMPHREGHAMDRIGWLRAAVLGANDGILSTASLVLGVAAGRGSVSALLLTGIAGLVAGAMSMAAGEYVSVSSQADAEAADRAREIRELVEVPDAERAELIAIYQARGLDAALAAQVADQLTARDPLGTHLRDELGQHGATAARPVQAALASAASFAAGAVFPVLMVLVVPGGLLAPAIVVSTLALLAALGALGAWLGGAPMLPGAVRVTFWGAAAMAATALIGRLVGAQV
ncbi:VIT1/CCC1 transporter family protein [Sphingomonas sp.]|uniref:VIT1/CCC1 transporter family protein n=1 Tax=Sphingomonas sp. TaxID=28214 RepID=UPI001D962860|nr:VIT1/CCC1 transporter family protein [Sphingomonas sp.]MBX9797777.1 VIT1/CCC1 transporter family protein [Sphingomonas sp.]